MAGPIVVSIEIVLFGIFLIYIFLKSKYPSKGLKVFGNLMKKRMNFEEAVKEFIQGKKIRRISSHYGYVLLALEANNYQDKTIAKYKANETKPYLDEKLIFSTEDVTANDWIIE